MNFFQWFKKRENFILPLCLVIAVFVMVGLYVFTTEIHGDGKIHTLYAKEIVQRGELLKYSPYEITVKEGEVKHLPIYYPLIAHTMMALFYMLGGEVFLKFFAIFFAVLTALFIYFLFKPFNRYVAFLIALLAIVFNTPRFAMVPLMEQPLLFALVAFLYYFSLFLKQPRVNYTILAGIFLGLAAVIKQQGLCFFGFFLLFCLGFLILQRLRKKELGPKGKHFLLLFVLAMVLAAGPLVNQLQRNGILIYFGGHNFPPFFTNKYPADPDAVEALKPRLGYVLHYNSLWETTKVYLLQPLYYRNAFRILREEGNYEQPWYFIFALLFLSGIVYLFRRDRVVLSLWLSVFSVSLVITYLTGSYPIQYHNIGVVAGGVFLVFGLFNLGIIVKIKKGWLFISLLAMFLGVSGVNEFVDKVHRTLFVDSQGYDSYRMEAYKLLGDFVKSNTSPEANFLAFNVAFQCYSQRKSLWLTEFGNANIPLILATKDQGETLKWLRYYQIDYIVVDSLQPKYRGVNSWIPDDGLLSFIDRSPNFQRLYNDGILKLYKVL